MPVAAFSACGSENSGAASDQNNASTPEIADETGSSTIVDNGGIYSIEDFEATGYKKVTQFDLETLSGAADAWFGFFNRKNIEARF